MTTFARTAFLSLCLAFTIVGLASAYPGYCQIELINYSHENVTVHVAFEDGASNSFQMQAHEHPHYIDAFYNQYCHSGAEVRVSDPRHLLYHAWTHVGATIRIAPY
jgi:hypothetical protein